MASKKSRTRSESDFSTKAATGVMIAILAILVIFVFSIRGPNAIEIGLNAELSGSLASVGLSSRRGAELAIKQHNAVGGVEVNGKKHMLDLNIQDNASEIEQSKLATHKLIEAGAAAIVGPNASKFAIPAAEVAERSDIVMISPWSTDPQTTLDPDGNHRPFVYRATFVDPFQGKALATFATTALKFTKAAVLFDSTSPVLKGQSDTFAEKFTADGGETIVTLSFRSGDSDFSTQLNRIRSSGAEFIFLPAYTTDAAAIMKLARQMELKIPFFGSDAWGSQEIIAACGVDCEGNYLSAHFSADSQDSITQEFVQDYQAAYGIVPDEVAALTYDSVQIIIKAIQGIKSSERKMINEGMVNLGTYNGATGMMAYDSVSGDPLKSVVILQISKNRANYVTTINPEP